MTRFSVLALLAALAPGAAAAADCGASMHQRLSDLTAQGVAHTEPPASLGQQANEIVTACGDDRAVVGHIMAMFAEVAASIGAPSDLRTQFELFAIRTASRIQRDMPGDFEPVALKDGSWSVTDERNAYWDLMLAASSDFLTYGAHADFYSPGVTQKIGCLLYPDEEASALATQARDGADNGELLVRIDYLGSHCDDADHAVSGQVALYFANQAKAHEQEGYVGLTGGDIRGGLQRFLPMHLDGRKSSELFTADEVAALMAY
jgi:hypothetical protein